MRNIGAVEEIIIADLGTAADHEDGIVAAAAGLHEVRLLRIDHAGARAMSGREARGVGPAAGLPPGDAVAGRPQVGAPQCQGAVEIAHAGRAIAPTDASETSAAHATSGSTDASSNAATQTTQASADTPTQTTVHATADSTVGARRAINQVATAAAVVRGAVVATRAI